MRIITQKDMKVVADRLDEINRDNIGGKDYKSGFLDALNCLGIAVKADPDHQDRFIAGLQYREGDFASPFGRIVLESKLLHLKGHLQDNIYEFRFKIANYKDVWYVNRYGEVDVELCQECVESLTRQIKQIDWLISNAADKFVA